MSYIKAAIMAGLVLGLMWMGITCIGCDGCSKKGDRYYYLSQERVGVETEVIKVYTDIFFSTRERLEIWRGIDRWNLVLNGYREMEDAGEFSGEMDKIREAESGGVYIIMRLEPGSELIKNDINSMTLGFTDAIGGKYLYLVPMYIGEENLYGVVLHEVGHLMGAEHTEEGLMRAGYDIGREGCVDKFTVEQIREYEWGRMNYCKWE